MSEVNGRVLNWKKGPVDDRDFKSVRHLMAPAELPDTFELDKQIPIYDQKDIGSCVANSACACYRYEHAQLTGDFKFDPSRLFEYYNARKLQGWENEDSGAYIRDGFKALNKWGLAGESKWPYVTRDFAKTPTTDVYDDGIKNVAVKYASVQQSESVIKQTVLSGAAVSFGFNVYSSFMYGSWIYDNPAIMPVPKKTEQFLGGHAVTIIGWDDSKKCFLIQNSWGTSWGNAGKFWMPYAFVLNSKECDDFWAIETIKVADVPVDPTPPAPVSEIDWKTVCNVLFKTEKELWAVRKTTLLRLGVALNVDGLNEKKSFRYNYDLIKKFIGL